jgi:DNA-binding PadR family transcriptional regulator
MRRLSITAVNVLNTLSRGVKYGFDVIDATGLPSGTVYPALSRLERDGFVKSTWEEETSAHSEGRPARRYYRVTASGQKALAEAAEHYLALIPSPGRRGTAKS